MFDGLYNKLKNCFSNENQSTYENFVAMFDSDTAMFKRTEEIADGYYGLYKTIKYPGIDSEDEDNVSVTGISFPKASVEWGLDDFYYSDYEAVVTPENATNQFITYSSSDDSVLSYRSGYSIPELHKEGTVTVTATSDDGGKTATMTVSVVSGHGKNGNYFETYGNGEILQSGSFGYVKFTLYRNGTLIYGSGKMDSSTYSIPWRNNPDEIKRVIIEYGVTSIRGWAFSGCTSLTSVTIPSGVTSIGDSAFEDCTSLTSVTIPDSVTSIGEWAFEDCKSLESITIPDSVTSIGDDAFLGCTSLTSITIPDSVTSIGGLTFYGCTSLTSVTIPDSVTSIESSAFENCTSLTSITIPDSVTSIGNGAFEDCTSLTSITIPSSVTSIGYEVFSYCTSLTSITIPSSVTSIGDSAFEGCTSLTSITIPSSVTSIGDDAFSDCTSLKTIYGTKGSYAEKFAKDNGYTFIDKDNQTVAVTGIKLDKTTCTIEKGKTQTLTATVTPSNATNKTITWTTSDSSVATVSGGRITAKNTGTATITAKTSNGKTATCKVTVKNPAVLAAGIKLDKTSTTLGKGETITLNATITPTNTTNKSVTWTTSNSSVATVSGGKITAKNNGTTTITAKTSNGKTATCKVTVISEIKPVQIELNNTEALIYKGKTKNLKATVYPTEAADKAVTWTTSNSKVATVSAGKITGIDYGTATITAKTSNGKTATCKVTVLVEETGISLNKSAVSMDKGKTLTLTATVQPANAYFKEITWSSSDEAVATVEDGKIVAKALGTTTITAETHNHIKATCKVTVKNPEITATKITLNKTSLTLGKGESMTVTAEIEPTNTTNKSVTWTTSNSSVATVSGGKITAKNNGTATITAKTSNGKTAACKVTVKNAPAKITLTKGVLTIGVGEKYSLGSNVNSGAGCATRTYRTSNSSVVKMTKTNWTGEFVGVKPGVAYVTVRTYNGKEHSCKVTVKAAPKSVTISKKTLTLKVGQTATLSCWTNDGSGCAKRTFRTSNSSIVKMTKTNWTGSFKAVKAGTAWVTVRTYNGKESSCKVTVTK